MHGVLEQDDGAVDDQAEVDRPQGHQVAADPRGTHPEKGSHHGERDHGRGHEPRADVPQHEEQHDDHQRAPLQQVVRDGVQRVVRPGPYGRRRARCARPGEASR